MKSFVQGLLLAAILLLTCSCGRGVIGGISSHYPAVDEDPWLTVQAGSALPLVEALERYRNTHSHYPKEKSDLVRFMHLAATKDKENLELWRYISDPKGYRLRLSLGWDPTLEYEQSGSTTRWLFDPGDGSPVKAIVLHPWPNK